MTEVEKRLESKLRGSDLLLAREILMLTRTKIRDFIERKAKEVLES